MYGHDRKPYTLCRGHMLMGGGYSRDVSHKLQFLLALFASLG